MRLLCSFISLFIIVSTARSAVRECSPVVTAADSVGLTGENVRRDSAESGPEPDALKLTAVGGLTGGGFLVGHVFLSNLWWKGEPGDFHFNWDDDWRYALGADKLGHFYFPYVVTDVYRQALQWCGLDTAASLYIGGGLSFLYTTYVEVRDGFSEQWGFSWGDFAANTLGAAWRVAEYHIPELRNAQFKISFYPSEKFRAGFYNAIIDDYESTYHWLSLNVHGMLPEGWNEYWPSFINIAVGHSVQDIDYTGAGRHELYLSLDWNLEALPGDGWLLRLLKHNLNVYHLPAPAIRITPNVVWYGLKF